jgi:phage/plasmid-associated DNA primase
VLTCHFLFIRFPGEKLNKIIGLFSSEGAGKGIFIKTLMALINENNSCTLQGTKNLTTWNSYLEGKTMLYLDEAPPQSFSSLEFNMIKAIVTEDRLRVEEKYKVERETRNCAELFFFVVKHHFYFLIILRQQQQKKTTLTT